MSRVANYNHPLKGYCLQWLAKIKDACRAKEDRFGVFAREAMQFYDGNHDFMWKRDYATGPGGFMDKKAALVPGFRMTVNRPFEAVALFGPALYHHNPNVLVEPLRRRMMPPEALGMMPGVPEHDQQYMMLQQQHQSESNIDTAHSGIFTDYLSWLQREAGKKDESRAAIQETIIKGMSLLMVEMHQPAGSDVRYPKARHVSVDDYVCDADASYQSDVQWAAIRYLHTKEYVARKFGLEVEDLKGHYESKESQGATYSSGKEKSERKKYGESFDLIEYWEIYSKNGFGSRLKSTDKSKSGKSDIDVEEWGDFCRIVVANGIPFPLNMPTWELGADPEADFLRSQWPVPFWVDESAGGGWPFVRMHFYDKPNSVWPIGLFKPAIGELRFVNWCMSFLADRVAQGCTTYVAMLKSAEAQLKDQLGNGQAPFTVLQISEVLNLPLDQVVKFIQAPQVGQDIWAMIAQVLELIDKRTGLTELIYGLTGRQMRSAQEASIRDANTSIRPDDMAARVEDCLAAVNLKEAEAAVYELDGASIAGPLGPLAAHVWDTQIRPRGIEGIARDFRFTIEPGSARKPNRATKIQQLQELGQVIAPVLQQMALGGQPGPWNAYMEDTAEAMQLKDSHRYMIQPPPPQEGPTPEQMEAQAEIEMMQAELQMKAQEHGLELDFSKQRHKQELKQDAAEHKQDMSQQRQLGKVKVEVAKAAAKAKPKPAASRK